MDDWNWETIRNATFNSIKDLGYKINYKKEVITINTSGDKSHIVDNPKKYGWHNGIFICVLEKL